MPTSILSYKEASPKLKSLMERHPAARGKNLEDLLLTIELDKDGNVDMTKRMPINVEEPPSQALYTAARTVASAPSTITATVAGLGTGALTAPAGPFVSVPAALGTGATVGGATQAAQDWATRKIAPRFQRYLDIGAQVYPKTTVAANVLSSLAGQKQAGIKALASLARNPKVLGPMMRRTSLPTTLLTSAGVGAGQEAIVEKWSGQDLSPGRIATAGLLSPLVGGGSARFGQGIINRAARFPIERKLNAAVNQEWKSKFAPSGERGQISMQDAYTHYAKKLAEAQPNEIPAILDNANTLFGFEKDPAVILRIAKAVENRRSTPEQDVAESTAAKRVDPELAKWVGKTYKDEKTGKAYTRAELDLMEKNNPTLLKKFQDEFLIAKAQEKAAAEEAKKTAGSKGGGKSPEDKGVPDLQEGAVKPIEVINPPTKPAATGEGTTPPSPSEVLVTNPPETAGPPLPPPPKVPGEDLESPHTLEKAIQDQKDFISGKSNEITKALMQHIDKLDQKYFPDSTEEKILVQKFKEAIKKIAKAEGVSKEDLMGLGAKQEYARAFKLADNLNGALEQFKKGLRNNARDIKRKSMNQPDSTEALDAIANREAEGGGGGKGKVTQESLEGTSGKPDSEALPTDEYTATRNFAEAANKELKSKAPPAKAAAPEVTSPAAEPPKPELVLESPPALAVGDKVSYTSGDGRKITGQLNKFLDNKKNAVVVAENGGIHNVPTKDLSKLVPEVAGGKAPESTSSTPPAKAEVPVAPPVKPAPRYVEILDAKGKKVDEGEVVGTTKPTKAAPNGTVLVKVKEGVTKVVPPERTRNIEKLSEKAVKKLEESKKPTTETKSETLEEYIKRRKKEEGLKGFLSNKNAERFRSEFQGKQAPKSTVTPAAEPLSNKYNIGDTVVLKATDTRPRTTGKIEGIAGEEFVINIGSGSDGKPIYVRGKEKDISAHVPKTEKKTKPGTELKSDPFLTGVFTTAAKVAHRDLLKPIVKFLGRGAMASTERIVPGAGESLARTRPVEGGVLMDEVMPESRREQRKLQNYFNEPVEKAVSKLKPTNKEIEHVTNWMDDMQDLGDSGIALTPREKELTDAVREAFLRSAEEQQKDGPLIEGEREKKIDPFYSARAIMSREVRKILISGTDAQRQPYVDAYILWHKQHNPKSDEAKAREDLNLILGKSNFQGKLTPTFAPLVKAEGIGLPPIMREKNILSRVIYHNLRSAGSLSWYRNVQKKPAIAMMFGLTDDGRGGSYKTSVSPDDPEYKKYLISGYSDVPQIPENLTGDPNFEAIRSELNLSRNMDEDKMEQVSALVNAMRLGPKSAFRDIVSSIGPVAAWMKPSELPLAAKAIGTVLAGKSTAVKQGAISGRNPGEFFLQNGVRNVLGKITDNLRKYQGRDLAEKGVREVLVELGKNITEARIKSNDTDFLEAFAGKNWRALKMNDLIERASTRFMEQVQGSYSPEYLNKMFTKGSQPGYLKATFMLSRWAFERARRYRPMSSSRWRRKEILSLS